MDIMAIARSVGNPQIETAFDGYRHPDDKGWTAADGYSCEVECGEFLYGLVRYLKPLVIVETGTYIGFAAACLASACKENKAGHVFTVEIRHDHVSRANRLINQFGLQEWCTVLLGDSLSDVVTAVLPGPIDLALIDGGDRVKEQEKYEGLLSPVGILLQHDALKFKDSYLLSQEKSMGFVWGLRGVSLLLPRS